MVRVAFYLPWALRTEAGAPQDGGCRGRTTPHHGDGTAPASHHGLLGELGLQMRSERLAQLPRGTPAPRKCRAGIAT